MLKMNFKQLNNPEKRYDFMFVFDVTDGNPNGDPDASNLPRVDPETMQGLVTDVSLKRKIRDYVQITKGDQDGYDIYVKQRGILTREQRKAYEALGIENEDEKSTTVIKDAREWMCKNYYDTRMFGAVMSTKKYNSGQVRGPIQLTFGRSIDQILQGDMAITRVALTNATDGVRTGDVVGEDEIEARHGQMGRKTYVPYGIYIAYGFYSPTFAKQTGVTSEDLETLWEALINMWDLDRSAARGRMATRGLYVFEHESQYGNAPSHLLFDKIIVEKESKDQAPRSSKDYKVTIDEDLPEGVTLHKVITF